LEDDHCTWCISYQPTPSDIQFCPKLNLEYRTTLANQCCLEVSSSM